MRVPVLPLTGKFIRISSKSVSIHKFKSSHRENTKSLQLLSWRPVNTALYCDRFQNQRTFSGGDVARAQGDGLMFDAVWTFQIPEDAQ